ncbi:hypothetical protein HPB50_002829 [Hyalomma asiaticum]|uniref:Uncharacterized protein n=1 Tax=Hyalomma asiaticum TaxID=266040 RepID=A0ACB7SE77_HYAAI|nr:hypothetical protein HPB50_002829 [Hyalomma asiaticum]
MGLAPPILDMLCSSPYPFCCRIASYKEVLLATAIDSCVKLFLEDFTCVPQDLPVSCDDLPDMFEVLLPTSFVANIGVFECVAKADFTASPEPPGVPRVSRNSRAARPGLAFGAAASYDAIANASGPGRL